MNETVTVVETPFGPRGEHVHWDVLVDGYELTAGMSFEIALKNLVDFDRDMPGGLLGPGAVETRARAARDVQIERWKRSVLREIEWRRGDESWTAETLIGRYGGTDIGDVWLPQRPRGETFLATRNCYECGHPTSDRQNFTTLEEAQGWIAEWAMENGG